MVSERLTNYMELPQKIKQPEERTMHGTLVVTHLSPTELKINELINYLESQKEGGKDEFNVVQKLDDCAKGALQDFIDSNEEDENGNYYLESQKEGIPIDHPNVKFYKEEPKQIDVCPCCKK